MKLKVIDDKILVQPDEAEAEKSPGGIIIPDTAKEKPQKGKINVNRRNKFLTNFLPIFYPSFTQRVRRVRV